MIIEIIVEDCCHYLDYLTYEYGCDLDLWDCFLEWLWV